MMSPWVTAVLFASLLTVIPFTSVLRMLAQLPPAVVLSHRRLPAWANSLVISVVAGAVALFIRTAYLGTEPRGPLAITFAFLIALLVYAFGLALLLRQFCGVYPEFIVTSTAGGLVLKKTSYRKIDAIEQQSEVAGEVRFRIRTLTGAVVTLVVPARDKESIYRQIRKQQD
jgi:hypothetical protein